MSSEKISATSEKKNPKTLSFQKAKLSSSLKEIEMSPGLKEENDMGLKEQEHQKRVSSSEDKTSSQNKKDVEKKAFKNPAIGWFLLRH